MNQPLLNWSAQRLERPINSLHIQPLAGDAGFRRYYRISAECDSWIAVDAPPIHIDNPQFCHIAAQLQQQSVRCPNIIDSDFEAGWLLLEDLGERLLLPELNAGTVNQLYSHAINLLASMSQTPSTTLPPYDAERLQAEMHLFREWFVPKLLGLTLSPADEEIMNSAFDALTKSALAQPQVFVHRDYHSRNIMLTGNDELAVIDFQDAVQGPLYYDLVSLIKDCYIAWPADAIECWRREFSEHPIIAPLLAGVDISTQRNWFENIGLQRHIKVLGIFARLSLRDNKHNYLNDLPLVIEYTRTALTNSPSPELSRLGQWFDERLLPTIKQQRWHP